MATRAIVRVTPAAERKDVTLRLTPTFGLPNCDTDASRVEQILVNLLGNAIKYAPAKSTVRVTITSDAGRVASTLRSGDPGDPDRARRLIGSVTIHSVPLCGELNFETLEASGGCMRAATPPEPA